MVLGQLYIHTQNNEAGLLHVTPYKKINSKWIKYPKVRAKAIKLSEKNKGVNLYELALYTCCVQLLSQVWFFLDSMDCSPPGSSVHGIFQARIIEWVATSYSRGSSWSRDQTHISCISCIGRQILYRYATWYPKHKQSEEKTDELEFIKIKNVCASEDTIKKVKKNRTSLEVQWLRLHTSNAGDMGSIHGPGRFHMPLWATKPLCHSYGAHALEPQLLKPASSRALELQLLKPLRPRAYVPWEKPLHWEACALQLETVCVQQRRPSIAKNK